MQPLQDKPDSISAGPSQHSQDSVTPSQTDHVKETPSPKKKVLTSGKKNCTLKNKKRKLGDRSPPNKALESNSPKMKGEQKIPTSNSKLEPQNLKKPRTHDLSSPNEHQDSVKISLSRLTEQYQDLLNKYVQLELKLEAQQEETLNNNLQLSIAPPRIRSEETFHTPNQPIFKKPSPNTPEEEKVNVQESIPNSIRTTKPFNPFQNPHPQLLNQQPATLQGPLNPRGEYCPPLYYQHHQLQISPLNAQPNLATGINHHRGPGIKKENTLILPWRGKILTPTFNQLRKYGGNLDAIMANLGYHEPEGPQRNYHQLRIKWKGDLLFPTPTQLLQSKGDLNLLKEILVQAQSTSPFQEWNPMVPSKQL